MSEEKEQSLSQSEIEMKAKQQKPIFFREIIPYGTQLISYGEIEKIYPFMTSQGLYTL